MSYTYPPLSLTFWLYPGVFHTDVLQSTNGGRVAKIIDGYQLAHGTFELFSNLGGTEPGDPAKAAANILAFVADPAREQLPLRFVVGDNAFVDIRAFYVQQLAEMEET